MNCLKTNLEAFLGYLTLVRHLKKFWLVILQGTLVSHLKSLKRLLKPSIQHHSTFLAILKTVSIYFVYQLQMIIDFV